MNNFIANPGLQHIGLNIFKNLDHQSLLNCLNVNQEWRNILNNPRFWLARAQKYLSKEHYTKWNDLIKKIYKEEDFFLVENVTLCIIKMLQKPTSKLFTKSLRRKYRKYKKFPNSIHGKVK